MRGILPGAIVRIPAASALFAALLALGSVAWPQPPVRFGAQPSNVPPGGAVQLCWDAPQASRLFLEPQRIWLPVTRDCIVVRPSGSTRYVLWVYDSAGRRWPYSADVAVIASQPAPPP